MGLTTLTSVRRRTFNISGVAEAVNASEGDSGDWAFVVLTLRRTQDWEEAVRWYESALNMTDYDEGGEFDGMQNEPRYLLLARLAEMYQEGSYSLTANPQRAGMCRPNSAV